MAFLDCPRLPHDLVSTDGLDGECIVPGYSPARKDFQLIQSRLHSAAFFSTKSICEENGIFVGTRDRNILRCKLQILPVNC